jgi:hypothetical protein
MRFRRKSPLQRVLDTVSDSLDVASGAKFSMPDASLGKARKAGLIAAVSAVGLTAGSAGVSSLRRRSQGARDGS